MADKRTSFHFPREATQELTAIRHIIDFDKDADIIRAALRVLHKLLDIVAAGDQIIIVDEGEREWLFSPYSRCTCPSAEARPSDREIETPADDSVAKNFFFSGDLVTILQSIRDQSFLRTNADAIHRALTKYRQLAAVCDRGGKIVVRCTDGSSYFFNPHAPQQRCPRAATPATAEPQ